MCFGKAPFDYIIELAKISSHREVPIPGRAVLPENMPLPKGTVLLETTVSASYHSFESLQIVGFSKHQRLIVGFAETSYELTFSGDADLTKLHRETIQAELLAEHRTHFTTNPNEEYLNWCPAKRVPCLEIREIQHRPETWGSLQVMTDLRAEPNHATFKGKIGRSTPDKGIDL